MTANPWSPRAGIGLRAGHCVDFLDDPPPVGFIEVHSENYFSRGGKALHFLERARRDRPLSLHGVGLSLGSCDALDERHLRLLQALVERLQPALVSEHLSWSSAGGVHAHDLLPLPCTEEALVHVVARVQRVQERLRRPILLENLSAYVAYADASMAEPVFLAEVARRSGCGVLLDLNNLHVSAHNLGFDAAGYLAALPRGAVRQFHLAGHVQRCFDDGTLLLDTHSRPVAEPVWALYRQALRRFGPQPTLIEWDAELPPLATLVAQARRADDECAALAQECTDVVAA